MVDKYNKKVGFWSGHLGERGTDVNMFNYAYFNQKLLGNQSYVFYPPHSKYNNEKVIKKFKTHFEVIEVNSFQEINKHLIDNKIKYLYDTKVGTDDGNYCKYATHFVHSVFKATEPHGDIYSAISNWVPGAKSNCSVLPYMVNLPDAKTNLRNQLNIPKNAIVFGGYGGTAQFNIKMAQNAVYNIAKKRKDIYFLFANFERFCEKLPNIIHLPCIIDLNKKVEFINTCDAMIWGRKDGETFGLAIAEFSSKNKPVIATAIQPDKTRVFDKSHVHLLGKKGIWYKNQTELENILSSFNKTKSAKKDWNAYKNFTPNRVMKIFDRIFLKPKSKITLNPKLKVLLFYRSHRHVQEIEISADYIKQTKNLRSCDLIFHCNNIKNNIWKHFVKFPNENKELIQTSTNAGYNLGCLQALSNNFDKFSKYDYVIHLQTDVFILDETKIVEILNQNEKGKEVFICTKSLPDEKFLSFDFFIFKPKMLEKNIFKMWENKNFIQPTPEFNSGTKWTKRNVVLPEHLLYKVLTLNNIPYKLIKRFDDDHWFPRRHDLLNLYHEHDLNKLENL